MVYSSEYTFEVRHFLEREVKSMEENSEIQEDLGNGGKVKNWLQDNIRVILSVLIVATIMAGIYSYSKRTVVPAGNVDSSTEINLAEADIEEDDSNAVVVVGEDNQDNKTEKVEDSSSGKLSIEQIDSEDENKEAKAEEAERAKEAAAQIEVNKVAEENKAQAEEEEAKKAEKTRQAEEAKKAEEDRQAEVARQTDQRQNTENSSEETGSSFDEIAGAGDSLTTLARRATQHYLEKNPTEGLSAEHKVYIEDYLQKQSNHSTGVNLGEKVSFSKDLISQAISVSKGLNQDQLKNLQKYSAMVSGL